MLFENEDTRFNFIMYLNEWKKTPIELNGKQLNILKSNHVMQPRSSNSKIPRDGNMTKGKYEKLIRIASQHIDIYKQFAIIFKDGVYYSGFTGVVVESDITIITAIFKQAKTPEKLFKNISNKYILERIINE